MTVPPVPDLEGLLAEDRWMRRLALRLAGDPHAAEELAQETWVAALGGGGGAKKLRPWLGGVVRNLWLDLRRVRRQRTQREQRAARGEALPSAAELASELELRQRVATALFELDEPYRRTLTLRFFHGHTLAEIARAEGASLTVIHERVQRGLARLRARLVRTSRDERESWAVALLALARPSGKLGAGLEAIAMASAWKLGTAATVLLGGGLAWWWHAETRDERPGAPLLAAEVERAPALLPSAVPPEPLETARESLAVSPPAALPPAVPVALPRLTGRVLEPSGAPCAGATVAWIGHEDVRATSAADGRFELDLPAGSATPTLLDFAGETGLRCMDEARVTLLTGLRDATGEPLVLVAPRTASAGVVVDEQGLPLVGASVSVRVRDSVFRELGVPRPTRPPLDASGRSLGELVARTDATGEFELTGAPGGEGLYLLVEATGHETQDFELPSVPDRARVLALVALTPVAEFKGTVFDEGNTPVAGARVSLGRALVTSDEEGRFHIAPGGEAPFGVDGQGLANNADAAPVLELVAVHPGHLPARLALDGHDPADPLELHLGPAPLAIRGRVLDAQGAPRAGVQVWPRDPTWFGSEVSQVSEGMTAAFALTIEDVLSGGYGRRGTRTDADGRFVLESLLPRTYSLLVFDPASAERAGPFEVEAGRAEVTLALAGTECVRVAGRIVSLGGEPLAGVEIRAQSTGSLSVYDSPPGDAGSPVTSDAEGRFLFERLAPQGTRLLLQHPRLMFRTVELAGRGDLEHLELVEPVLCELQVDLTRDPALADKLQVLDAAGQPLELIESFGVGLMTGVEARFTRGLSEVLGVRESGTTLVLLKGGLEVLRRPLALDPEQRTVFRP